jgi:error-prone DNA polymerase
MGFYSSATLIKDGQRHGVKFRPVCVAQSDDNCTIEADDSIRLGFCVVKTLRNCGTKRLLEERTVKAFASLEDFRHRVRLNKDELRALAEVGALNCFARHRRGALWEIEREMREGDLFETALPAEKLSPLQRMTYLERIQADFASMNLTTGKHPMALLRSQLPDVQRASDLPAVQNGNRVRIAGNVICRQRPGTAKGFVFISLEDETGISNAIVTPPMFEANRLVITEESFLIIEGPLQHVDNVIHVKAEHIERLNHGALTGSVSYDFH